MSTGTRFTLTEIIQVQQEIKKSRFMAVAAPVSFIEQAQQFLAKHIDASTTHQCWAWKINGQSRISDDGEPAGTAGRPILAVIEGQALDNVLVMVNRWYGGTKLGTGGLMRAYSSTAQLCLQTAVKVPLIVTAKAWFYVPFAHWAKVQHHLSVQNITVEQIKYIADGVEVYINLPSDQFDSLNQWLRHWSSGQQQLRII